VNYKIVSDEQQMSLATKTLTELFINSL